MTVAGSLNDETFLTERRRRQAKENAVKVNRNHGSKTMQLEMPLQFTGVLTEDDAQIEPSVVKKTKEEDSDKKATTEIVWPNVTVFVVFHFCALLALYWLFTGQVSLYNMSIIVTYSVFCSMGITAGAHRLWAHRAYKAKLPLRVILIILQTLSVQNSLYEWVRDHRVHHKFTETNADPHNIKRGFFFAHVGWLLTKKHPDVKTKGKLVDMSDLEKDPLVMWQHKYYPILAVISIFILPSILFRVMTNETWFMIIVGGAVGRYVITLNLTWLVNSYAHVWGDKPYDKLIEASDTKFVAIAAMGEGWHNYHHVFPWDYKTSELGFYRLNFTTAVIDFFAKIGWAYDLKTVPKELIKGRVQRTGDGSHPVWGWGDKEIPREDIAVTQRIYAG